MDAAILDYVRERVGGVTFAELSQRIPGFNGDYSLCLGGNRNVVLWDGMSREAFDAFSEGVLNDV
jgi:hypothetical protein